MTSDDSKEPVREEQEEEDAEDKSLSSILSARKKNPTNAGALTNKSRPRIAKVKKEEALEVDDDDFDAPIKGKGGSSGSRAKSIAAKVKKEENVADDDDDDDDDRRPLSKRNSATKADQDLSKKKKEKEEEKKKKKKKKKKGSTTTEENGKKKEKKVYDLPGQKRDPPLERDPLRIFYETLYKQVPYSDMAQIWMMESGLLSMEEAKKVYDKKQKKNQQKPISPLKAATPSKRTQSQTVRKSTPTSAKNEKADPKISSKQSKKQKIRDGSSEDGSDEDFLTSVSKKKQRAS